MGLLKINIWRQTRSGPGFDQAEAAFKRAIELSPNHARAYMWYASLADEVGRFDETIALYRKSLELDPLGRIARSNLARVYAQLGRHDQAMAEWLELVRIHPDWPTGYDHLAEQLARLGRLDEAFAWATRARELSNDPLSGQAVLGVLVAFGERQRVADLLEQWPETHPFAPMVDGFQKMFLRDHAAALASWESAFAQGQITTPRFVYDPMSDAAALLGDYDTSLNYCLLLNPELAEANPAIESFNAHNAIKYAFLMQKTGKPERARQILDAVDPVVAHQPRLGAAGHGLLDVQVLALRGRPGAAIDRLRQAYEEGLRGATIFDFWELEETPYFEAFRNDPEFLAIVRDMDTAVGVMRDRVARAEAADDLESLRKIAFRAEQ